MLRNISNAERRRIQIQEEFRVGYRAFEFSVMLPSSREQAGVTQETIARKLRTKKSAISRIENHAEDIRLSTLRKVPPTLLA